MKKVLFISTIVLLSSCELKEDGNKTENKDSTSIVVPKKDSTKPTTPVVVESPPGAAISELKQVNEKLTADCINLEKERDGLIKDTARLGLANRQLVSENKKLVAEKSKVPAKSQTDDCAAVRKENASLKKTNQTLTIRNAALEGQNDKLTKQLNPQNQDKTKPMTRGAKKREEYKKIFDAVNGGKN